MIDRQAIIAEVRNWVEEVTGLGFRRSDVSLWERGQPDELRVLTARGVATKVRRKPKQKIERLSETAEQSERVLERIAKWDHRYRTALILYACAPNVTAAAAVMRRNLVDFGRFSEAGFALYAVYGNLKPVPA